MKKVRKNRPSANPAHRLAYLLVNGKSEAIEALESEEENRGGSNGGSMRATTRPFLRASMCPSVRYGTHNRRVVAVVRWRQRARPPPPPPPPLRNREGWLPSHSNPFLIFLTVTRTVQCTVLS